MRAENITPLRQFIVKIASRCDFSCDYCYVYESVDQSWRTQPIRMSDTTVAVTARRIGEHARMHGLDKVSVILHGGEPLLAGDRLLRDFFDASIAALAGVDVRLAIQTNAARLTPALVSLFVEYQVAVGVSLDGDRAHNDRHRSYRNGASTFDATARGLELLLATGRETFAGLLCVIDVDNDPLDVYAHLRAYQPPQIDFLLPHGSWSRPPPALDRPGQPSRYGRWLLDLFRYWHDAKAPQPRIRMFDEIIHLLLGGQSKIETIGRSPAAFAVIDTDGSIQHVDSLKAVSAHGVHTGLNVYDHGFNEYLALPEVRQRQEGVESLCATCRSCPVVEVCGGGLYTHRYSDDNGFGNPSVYCADLYRLIYEVSGVIRRDLQL